MVGGGADVDAGALSGAERHLERTHAGVDFGGDERIRQVHSLTVFRPLDLGEATRNE